LIGRTWQRILVGHCTVSRGSALHGGCLPGEGINAKASATESLVGVLVRRNKRAVLGREAEAVVPVSNLYYCSICRGKVEVETDFEFNPEWPRLRTCKKAKAQ
jgi:hypothetical protein